MQAIKRYFLVAVTLILVSLLYFAIIALKHRGYLPTSHNGITSDVISRRGVYVNRSYVVAEPSHTATKDLHLSPKTRRKYTHDDDENNFSHFISNAFSPNTNELLYPGVEASRNCTMDTCFDFSLCANGFKVYVYPETRTTVSPGYRAILSTLLESKYYTVEPSEACLFVLAIDTLDRDVLSTEYVPNVPELLHNLQPWTKMRGKNHVIFNMYSGTWPSYSEDLGFDYGRSILAKASMPSHFYRHGFDVSLPLFSKEHPHKGGERGQALYTPVSAPKYLLTFKGKRYLKGTGSDARNVLHHIHNNDDIVLLTTCRHGKNWKNMADERCEEDNTAYDRYDFKKLLSNSTFCLVPRGRRLGSYRFLEALQMGCIPVLVSNDWPLPFHDHIDWRQAAIWADERLVFQVRLFHKIYV